MTSATVVLDTLNILTDPISFNLFQIIMKKPTRYNDLLTITDLSTHTLSKNLEKLLQYSLVKTNLIKTDGGNFTGYQSTNLGKKFLEMLHDVMLEFDENVQDISGNFILDSSSFIKLVEKYSFLKINQIFRDSTIIFTNEHFSDLVKYSEKIQSTALENFLYDDEKVNVAKSYNDPKSGVRTEYYLRRAKKLQQDKAQLIATALDRNAGIISDDEKLIRYAKQLRTLSVNVESVLKLDGQPLREQFYELATSREDKSSIEVINPLYYSKNLKKN